jgi:phosphopantothenoylcysteine decarboxylase/phosphopantothenate--cysteine ligase
MKRTVVLGVTSGIAAFKSVDLVKLLKQENLDVHVIVTEKASKIVSLAELADVSGNKVHTELFEKDFDYKKILNTRKVEHIALADSADVFLIAPATANTLAKIAGGFADDFLTTTLLAVTKPIIVCPSMNVNMWNNPVVKENLAKIKQLGYIIVKPISGMLACGYEGEGKLEDITKIKDEVLRQVTRSTQLKGKKVIVTAGGTKEKIDDVRFISNGSSGKMGAAIAEALFLRGAEVLLIRAKESVKPRYVIKEVTFETSAELADIMKQNVKDYDTIFHAAAVADFTVSEPTEGKISSSTAFTLTMVPQAKIINAIKDWNPNIQLIAFKTTAGKSADEMIEIAKAKIADSRADIIIANDIKAVNSNDNEVILVFAGGQTKPIPRNAKPLLAEMLLDDIHI